MTATLVLVVIIVAVIAAVVLLLVPIRHTEAAASRFHWNRAMQLRARRWVKRKSKREPSGEFRNLVIRNANDPERRLYVYEQAVWRNTRRLEKSGDSQDDVQWPVYSPGPDENVRSRREVYKVTFRGEAGLHYTAKVRFARWQSLRRDQHYRLGRTVFGVVRTIRPAPPVPARARGGKDEQSS
jgi:hypothetical protein